MPISDLQPDTGVKEASAESDVVGRPGIVSALDGTWSGMPVTRHTGDWRELVRIIPTFERREFRLDRGAFPPSELNDRVDVIVRVGDGNAPDYPLAVVSRQYVLVQQTAVFQAVVKAVEGITGYRDRTKFSLRLTEHGERMGVSALLPAEIPFTYDLATDDHMRFRVECFNSVDGKMRFMLTWGWLRFVCGNGMVTGRALGIDRRSHRQSLDIDRIDMRVRDSVAIARDDARQWNQWRRTRVSPNVLAKWVDGILTWEWGPDAATRVWAICNTGHDAVLRATTDKSAPSKRAIDRGLAVPGSLGGDVTQFHAMQAMSWVAGSRKDVGQRVHRIAQIPKLVTRLKGELRPKSQAQKVLAL